jgi:hypothetical protein
MSVVATVLCACDCLVCLPVAAQAPEGEAPNVWSQFVQSLGDMRAAENFGGVRLGLAEGDADEGDSDDSIDMQQMANELKELFQDMF